MYPPDGLLTFEGPKHDVKYDPRIIATDPFISNDCIDDFAPVDLRLVTTTEELKMNTSEDEPLSGLNGRLRPRKSHVPSPQGKSKTKPDGKPLLDKPKRTSTLSKTSPNKQDDLASKSDFSPSPQFLCPYCDRKFASRQTVSKHIRRIHYATPKQEMLLNCLFCNHTEADANLIRHMVDSHPNQYFACLDCHTRFPSTSELAEHKLNVCEKQKITYQTKPRSKITRGTKKAKKSINISTKTTFSKHGKDFQESHGFNGIVISCELKPPQDHDAADIEDNITTNLILPRAKNLGGNAVLEKNAVIVLDDLQWNKRLPTTFSFHNTDPDQILSRLGVVHRSPRTGESTRKDWFKVLDDATQKFERCFDTKFYSKVASNVQENLVKFLDGSFNFNPDPDSTIKTRKSKNNVVINTAEGFPILLANEQYSRSVFDSYLPRAIAPKHKWKWDNLENDRSLMTAAELLRRDSHTNNCIITLVSSLDIWTQLSMRQKFDDKFNVQPVEKKTEKQNIISKELKEILESREIPTTSQIVKKCSSKTTPRSSELEFPASLGLVPAAPTYEVRPAVLSGEWVRPRCLVCCACGEQTTDSKGLSLHMSTRHPNASVQCYEIVGEPLLNADILKHLYVPPSQVCNRTRPPRGFRECTKCNKSITLDDLHQHMLDCAGDTPAVRRRQPRQRPFGVRRRRPRLPDTIRKKMRKDIRSRQRRQKNHGGPRPRIRTEVGDAETIRKMLADLPAKRHRVLVNPLNTMQRPRRKLDMQRTKLMLKKCSAEEAKSRKQNINKETSGSKEAPIVSDDSNKNMSGLDDDEDNKPLKPKIKLTSSASVRRREPLKRQVVINTTRRKSLRAGKRKVETENKILDASGNTEIQENCLDKSPQKLDLKKASYNTREQAANRGASSNRDGQRPGCSGTNGTANNSCAPTQNVPLKHSIARLTANSETHDKSVQFHHSFLVQQECNNTNQHVPAGERTLFENEAVVSKLDKPPLNFCHKSFLEVQSLQKNKANKTRKGLNDCIAMLKNKLVDPVSCESAGYVSVQCGSDEPIDDEPRVAIKVAVDKDNTGNVDLHAESMQSLASISSIPQYGQEISNNALQSPENTKIQEHENGVLPCRQDTTKNVNQNPEISQPQESYEPDKSHTIKQNSTQLSKLPNVSPQHSQDNFQKINPSLKTLQLQEKLSFLPPCRQENFEKVEETHSQEKVNLLPQYGEDTTQNVKQKLQYTHFPEKVTLITQFRQETSQNVHISEFAHSQERIDSSTLPFRQETALSVKQGSDCLNFQERANLLHQYRHESTPKVKQSLQFPDKIDTVPQTHEIARKVKQQIEFLPSPENLNVQYRQETMQKFNLNTEIMRFPENLTLPQYQTTQNITQGPESLHQEKVHLAPQYRQVSTQRLKVNDEVNCNLSQETSAVLVDCEIDKTICKEVSPRLRPRHDSGQFETAEAVKPISKRRSTEVFVESDSARKDRLESRTSWQKPLGVFSTKSGTLQTASSYSDTTIHNNAEVTIGSDLIHTQSIDVFTESRIRDIPANIPPAHASTIVDSILSAPLDLSSKVSNSANLSQSENYDNYGTLDLSNKNANRRSTNDTPVEENGVVDLRVKPLYPRSSPVTLDLCVKAGSSNNGDFTVTVPGLHNFPTDLSIRGRDLLNKSIVSTPNLIHNLSATSSTHLKAAHLITSPGNDNIYQSDSSITTDKALKPKVALPKASNSETRDSTDSITKNGSFASADSLSDKTCTKKQKISQKCTLNADQTYRKEQIEVQETVASKVRADSGTTQDIDKLSKQLQKHIYDPTLKIPQYKIRANISVTETTSTELIKEPTQSMTLVPQDLAIQNSTNGPSEVFQSTTMSSSIPTLTCVAVPGQTITLCVSSSESTINSSIAVTKLDSSNATGSPLFLESTVTSTVPVHTLTDTAVDLPNASNNEHVTVSAKTHDLPSSSIENQNDNLSESDTSTSAHSMHNEEHSDDSYDDFYIDEDPEIAKKIAVFPKELRKILGTMPDSHRNQLLNILPQYVSTTAPNDSTDSRQTNRDSIDSVPTTTEPPIPANDNGVPLVEKEDAHTSDQVFGADEQDQNLPYKSTSSIPEISTDVNYQPVNDSINLVEESKTMADLKLNATDGNALIATDGNACVNNSTNNLDRIIDLTEDEILPPISNVIDSSSISIPPQALSFSGRTSIPTKQKGNNDKTASLRAVRIKAPSLRQKEKQNLNQSPEERVFAQNEHDAAMQLAEMSMTHLDSKTVIHTREINILPAGTTKDTSKETSKCHILPSDVVDDKNVSTATGDANKILSTATSPNLPLDCDRLDKKQNDAVSENQLTTNINVVNTSAPNVEYTTRAKICQSGKDISLMENLNNNNLNVPMQENKVTTTHEEEDSEDDIILAAIVKQKQQTRKLPSKKSIKKKIKKKSRKNTIDSNFIIADNGVKLYCNVESLVNPNINEVTPKHVDILSSSSKLEQNKKKGSSNTFSQDTVREGQDCLSDVNSGNEARKPQSADFDSCCESRNVVTEEHGKENDDNLTNVKRTNQTETISAKTQEGLLPKLALNLKQSENVLQREKPKKKKKFTEPKSYKLSEQEKPKDEVSTVPLKSITSDKTTSEIQVSQSCNVASKTKDLLQIQIEDINEHNLIKLKSDVKKSVKIDRSKKYSSDFSIDNLTTESQDYEDNCDAPLRRSRRGKSVYLEGRLTANENFNVDFMVDQKAPLTKKQLIFSKLLLDEEKQTRSLILSPEKGLSNNNIERNDLSETTSEILARQSKTDISDDSTQKSKSVKRKNTPHLKKVCKKKKSGNFSEDYSLTDESDSNIKSNQKIVIVKDAELSAEPIKNDESHDQIPKRVNIILKSTISHTDTNAGRNDSVVDIERKHSHDSLSSVNTNAILNRTVPEKRKISKVPNNIESDQNSKPKKSKSNKVKEDDFYGNLENDVKMSSVEVESCTKLDTSNTTCYDVPVAARRTRSKSVIIKSSRAELYDPYDIDLDDMIQKPEPLRKPGVKVKEIKAKRKSSSKLTEIDALEERELVDQKTPITTSLKLNKMKCDLLVPSIQQATCDQEAKTKTTSAMVGSVKTMNTANLTTTVLETSDLAIKDSVSDSDESSKSDVPLKKYVDDRVKKLAATRKAIISEASDTIVLRNEVETEKQNNSGSNKNLRTSTVNKDSFRADLSNEIEQQMRSEQFMESFGFFSERKPRKSNLLATKKISETFHIIANEGEDLYYSSKEKPSRKPLQTDTKKSTEGSNILQSNLKKSMKRGRKKKSTKTLIRYCAVCKKEFRRPDNYSRHLITLLHVSKLSEVELKVKTLTVPEEPNYLIAFKQQMDRLKILTAKAAKQKKNSKTKIVLPSLDEILAEVHKIVREQQLARRGLSRDEALFLDCCELLNKPHRPDVPAITTSGQNVLQCTSRSSDLHFPTRSIERSTLKTDDDVDSITAKNIMESEEVRYLENDLISGLHQIANVKNANKKDEYHATPCTMTIHPHEISADTFSRRDCDVNCQQMKVPPENIGASVESDLNKPKKVPEYKEKMYPDIIEDIDMFEDKFDKIKRKCRSQAAAAKQVQSVMEPSPGHKGKKKTDKKKGKKSSKKNSQNTVMTKGALKGFDGIKVSIPTSDINMSAIGVVLHESSQKKKRKTNSKKKREKDSETNSRFDSDHRLKDITYSQKKVDVYEFMDNEDAELFEFRPSTLMERFKSINKETPSTSKRNATLNDPDNSSESASDGDDFVYMSDDYVCSDDETENSSLSCELLNEKNDTKKPTPLKRKDVVEKNAVMGKIFKNNAVRSEKKSVKSKETVNPKANLDQLFDSLLEEPNLPTLNDSNSLKQEQMEHKKQQKSSPKRERNSMDDKKSKTRKPSLSSDAIDTAKSNLSSKNLEAEHNISIRKYDASKQYEYSPSNSKQVIDIYAPSSSGTYVGTPVDCDESLPKIRDISPSKRHDIIPKSRKSPVLENLELETKLAKSQFNMLHESAHSVEFDDDTGVARHRARRKCTVGKQNVLAETWSSESEPDGLPPRPASAESVVTGAGRKKKGRKRDSQQAFGRRSKVTFNKKHDIESRVTSNKWNTADSGATSHSVVSSERRSADSNAAACDREACPPPAPPGPAGPSFSGVAPAAEASTSKVRPRPTAYYWTSEGDDEQEHQQQHGWIVGNSHKRLVTMLAHAKGRKRNNDDKRHLVE